VFLVLQGLAYNAKKNILYVADTENHALRYMTTSTSSLIFIVMIHAQHLCLIDGLLVAFLINHENVASSTSTRAMTKVVLIDLGPFHLSFVGLS
jgi:hypothetical protein